MIAEMKFLARRFSQVDIDQITTAAETKHRPSEVKEIIKDFYEARVAEVKTLDFRIEDSDSS